VTPPLAAGPGQHIRLDPRLAQWWRRLLGWAIDTVLIGILAAGLWIPVVDAYGRNYRSMLKNPDIDEPAIQAVTAHVLGIGAVAALISACIAVAYYWLLTGFWGTTSGKRALGTWVVTANGWTKVSQRSAFLRAAVFVVGPVIPFFFLVDNLWLLAGSQRQCLHDKAASTVVVKASAIGR